MIRRRRSVRGVFHRRCQHRGDIATIPMCVVALGWASDSEPVPRVVSFLGADLRITPVDRGRHVEIGGSAVGLQSVPSVDVAPLGAALPPVEPISI